MDEEQRKISQVGADTVIQVLSRHPELMKASQPLGAFLLFRGKLDPRIRELAILRVALRCDAPYEWANHVPAAIGGGATEAEADPAAPWAPADDAVLRAVDEVCADVYVSDETWAAHDHSPVVHSARPPRESTGEVPVDGTWKITFEHPGGNQDLLLTLETADGAVTGSVANGQQGITVPVVDGTIDGDHLSFTAPMTKPIQIDIAVEGTIDGDSFTGKVTIAGGGTFPFSGTRAT